MLFSVLQLFISIRMEKCYSLKGQSLENGLFCIFQAIANILNSKQKQQNTKVKVKEIDLIWSQICSSLLQSQRQKSQAVLKENILSSIYNFLQQNYQKITSSIITNRTCNHDCFHTILQNTFYLFFIFRNVGWEEDCSVQSASHLEKEDFIQHIMNMLGIENPTVTTKKLLQLRTQSLGGGC